jgi:hypothetical protein
VSDRWHLLRNLGDAVRAVVDRHHGDLRRAAQQMDEPILIPPAEEALLEPAVGGLTAAQRRSRDAHARRRDRYGKAAGLRAAGNSISAIAASLGAERKTVRRWLRAGKAPLWKQPPQGSILTEHDAYLDGRWAEGCRNAALLWRELVGLGFCGRPGIVGKGSDSNLVLTVLVSGSIVPTYDDDQERSPPVEEWAQDPGLYGYRTGVDDRGDSGTASRMPGLWFGLDVQAQLVSPDAPGPPNSRRPYPAGAPYLSLAMSPSGMQAACLR